MLAIKDAYDDIPCPAEYLIASSMVNGECKSIDDVMRRFNLTRKEALVILDGRSFNKVIDKLIKAKKVLGNAAMISRLVDIIHNGSPEAMLDAIQTVSYLARQWKPNGKRSSRKRQENETYYVAEESNETAINDDDEIIVID